MLDFDKGKERLNNYLGAEKKTTVLYEDEIYMLKYPDPIRGSKLKGELSYKNNQFSEYVGCKIFKFCGFITQDTALGYFTDRSGKRKIVVGCKDFTQHGGEFFEMKKLGNQTAVDGVGGKIKASIEDVYDIINESPLIKNKHEIIAGFWDMFVVDALIGNGDRHLGNWGLMVNNDTISLAPIYDCGSSLEALLSDDAMKDLLERPQIFTNTSRNQTSCYSLNGKRIFNIEIFKKPPADLANAILRIVPKIDIDKINGIIEATPIMSDIRKEYLKKSVTLRYEEILAPALKRISKQEQKQHVPHQNAIYQVQVYEQGNTPMQGLSR